MDELIEKKALTKDIADMLQMCVNARLNVLISGGTGAGKTTFSTRCLRFIPENERIVTIEDSAELQLQQPHVVQARNKATKYRRSRRSDSARSGQECAPHATRPDRNW